MLTMPRSLVRDLLLHIEGAFDSLSRLLVDIERCAYNLVFACGRHSEDEGHSRATGMVLALSGRYTSI